MPQLHPASPAEETPQTWRDLLLALPLMVLLAAGCTPTVAVEAPKEPITINLNVKLDAEVRVKLEEQAEETVAANPDIF